ncbi:MAG: hypothetical protein JOZ80_14070 [Acidobacteriaceae bacterium]|nr:hypothetical protein [Acidobacteriaceae bacterium]
MTDLKRDNLNPTRITESHSQNANRTVDTQSIQMRGLDGHLVPYQEIEKETLQLDATTAKTITRTFGRDVNGAKTLVQVTEEEKHADSNGDSSLVRITSNPDVNGELQPVQRELVSTKRISKDLEETQSTVMIASINGGLVPVLKTDEITKLAKNNVLERQKTTALLDGNDNWQPNEIRQTTIKKEGEDRRMEERISRLDAENKLHEVSRIVSTESGSLSAEKRNTVATYSLDLPGVTPDGHLHLVERTTTIRHTDTTGEQITERQLQQPDPGNPDSGLRVSILINDTMYPAPSGAQATYTIQMRNPNGDVEVVSVDTTKSDSVPTFELEQSR